MAFNVKVEDTINERKDKVFKAIVSPEHLTGYFATQSSGPLNEGEQVLWTFDDVGAELKVKVDTVDPNSSIQFEWRASGKKTQVQIQLIDKGHAHTHICITESEFEMGEEEVKKALQQTQGWTDFICSLKAYLYTGINLRVGRSSN